MAFKPISRGDVVCRGRLAGLRWVCLGWRLQRGWLMHINSVLAGPGAAAPRCICMHISVSLSIGRGRGMKKEWSLKLMGETDTYYHGLHRDPRSAGWTRFMSGVVLGTAQRKTVIRPHSPKGNVVFIAYSQPSLQQHTSPRCRCARYGMGCGYG